MKKRSIGIMFVIGILLCGIGVGVEIMEFSSFTYAGDVTIGAEAETRKTVERTISDKGDIYLVNTFPDFDTVYNVIRDENVPKDKIIMELVYNGENLTPADDSQSEINTVYEVRSKGSDTIILTGSTMEKTDDGTVIVDGYVVDSHEEVTEKTTQYLEVFNWTDYRGKNEAEIFFEIKDRLLEDIKKNRIGNYMVRYVKEITVRVNPENAGRLIY